MLIRSFGYKYFDNEDLKFFMNDGNPTVGFDARGIPNPYNRPELRNLTGLDKPVRDYVMSSPVAQELVDRIIKSVRENNTTSVAIGCFGGRHRSVVIAEEVGRILGVKPCHLNLKS